jgi:Tfp pilus assembly protein PilX
MLLLKECQMMTGKRLHVLKDQSGAALVIALIMIIVLTLIALASSYTSIFEVILSGNKRGTTDAFYTADGGVQAVLSATANFQTSSYTAVPNTTSLPQALRSESIDQKLSNPVFSFPTGFAFTDRPDVTIYHTTRSGAPRGSGFSASGSYDFVYYVIDSTGRDQLDASSLKSNCEVAEKVVVLVPTLQGGN